MTEKQQDRIVVKPAARLEMLPEVHNHVNLFFCMACLGRIQRNILQIQAQTNLEEYFHLYKHTGVNLDQTYLSLTLESCTVCQLKGFKLSFSYTLTTLIRKPEPANSNHPQVLITVILHVSKVNSVSYPWILPLVRHRDDITVKQVLPVMIATCQSFARWRSLVWITLGYNHTKDRHARHGYFLRREQTTSASKYDIPHENRSAAAVLILHVHVVYGIQLHGNKKADMQHEHSTNYTSVHPG